MKSAEADALLAAVLHRPEDDAPRLIYADWLDEHGQPERATFIRLQVERSRRPMYDPRREVLSRVAERLFDRHGADWVAELPQLDGLTWGEFDRGFPRAVIARSLAHFERAANQVADAAPVDTLELRRPTTPRRLTRARPQPQLRALRILYTGLTDRPDEFFDSPLLSTLESLKLIGLGPELANDGVIALAHSRRLEHLRELALDQSQVGSAGLIALARARGLRNLTQLSIRGETGGAEGDDPVVRSDGLEALAGSHVFGNLEALDLSGNDVNDEALTYLVESPHLVNLKELNLASNDMSDDGLDVLEELDWEMRLEALDLSHNRIGDRGARRIAEAEVCNELQRLVLNRCEIGADGAEALAAADWFPGLRSLSLDDNAIGVGVRAIAANGHALGELRLRNNDVGSAGARAIAGSPALAGLLILDIASNKLGSAGIRDIGSSPHVKQLAILDVGYNGMPKEAGLIEPAVGALTALVPTLVSLCLDGNHLSTPGILGLVTDVEWAQLAELGLRNCGLNRPALGFFARDGRFPTLTRLGVGLNAIDPAGLNDLLGGSFIAGLSHLDLSHNYFGNDGAKRLANADLLRLRWLSVEANNLRGPGFQALVRSTKLPRLVTLRYGGNPLGDWWRNVQARFQGDEDWPQSVAEWDEEIPF